MTNYLPYTISAILIVTGIIWAAWYSINYYQRKQQLRKQQEEERLVQERIRLASLEEQRFKDKAYVESLLYKFQEANNKLQQLQEFKQGYFNAKKLTDWQSTAKSILKKVETYNLESLKLEQEVLASIKMLESNFQKCESIRKKYNQIFVEHELTECDDLFSDIDNASLDEQQRLAIVKDEDNNLVIAGAGSGKTTTVAGKVTYLVKRWKVKPDEILLITFTRKAADEMRDRIRMKMGVNIEVNTFHSFGRKVIGEVTKNMPTVIEDSEFSSQMKEIFSSLMSNSEFAGKVIKFITEYRLEPKDTDDFKSHGEYINYLKDQNVTSYKTVEKEINGRITILREKCKSLEEVKIANFLFLNSVDYQYEAQYEHPTADNAYAQYRPDFYLPAYGIYIEHFGIINKDYDVPHWFSSGDYPTPKDKYNAGIDWKRSKHEEHQTTLVETYSYENKNDLLLPNLQQKLEALGVVFTPRTNEEVWEILNSVAKDEVSALDTLLRTFLNLFKSNNYNIPQVKVEINKQKSTELKNRHLLFLSIFEPILDKYNEYLQSKNLIDFSDMINQAATYINEKKFNSKYKYIIIDEFQDTSVGRYHLVKSLLENNTVSKLFAVGDDWQSIYRFAGSDISLFTKFEKYFGATEISRIETTYRFGDKMIDLSSEFILKNPNQTSKQLRPFVVNETEPLEIIYNEGFGTDDPQPLIDALRKIDTEISVENTNKKIIALSRYNHFIKTYKERQDLFLVKYDQNENNYKITYRELPHLTVEYLSVHRSKGLQAEYVILLNCVSGQYGFPSEQADDPVLNLLLSKSDQFINGEERRLFYVALTRAKKKTFITTNTIYTSKFVKEIDPNRSSNDTEKCPVCKEGTKVRYEGINRYGNHFIRLTCSNWSYDCDYLEWVN